MSTAILVLSVDEAGMLERCLPRAAAQPDAELVVVDNASTDGTAAVARAHGARVVRLERRRSYAAAMNLGLAEVRAAAVLLLNADCFLDPGFLAAARPRLEEPAVGSVAPKLRRAGAPGLDAAGMVVDRRRKNGLVGHGRPVEAHALPAPCFGPDGACALYRREVLDACALPPGPRGSGAPEVLDEDMALWATDADLAWRAQLLGWRCAYEPAATAAHVRTYSPSTRAQVAEAHRRLQFRNRYLMWAKNETAAGLWRDAPLITAYEAAAFGYVLLRERHLLAGYREVRAGLPAARRRRRIVQGRRVSARPPFGLEPPR